MNMSNAQIRSAQLLVQNALASPEILAELKSNPKETLEKLRDESVGQLPVLEKPDGPTNNAIWLIVVIAFVLVLVGMAGVLGMGVFTPFPSGSVQLTKTDTILTVLMSVISFLAGLLSPSPVSKRS